MDAEEGTEMPPKCIKALYVSNLDRSVERNRQVIDC